MKIWRIASLIVALIISTDVSALLIDNGSYTTDSESGLDWLDLTETIGMSYNDVSSQFGYGGLFEGWQYATRNEISTLINAAGGDGIYNGWSTSNNGIVIPLLELWGSTNGQYESRVLTGDSAGYGNVYFVGLFDDPSYYYSSTSDSISMFDDMIFPVLFGSPVLGSALVRSTVSVPEPTTMWLLGVGVFVLSGAIRRNKYQV